MGEKIVVKLTRTEEKPEAPLERLRQWMREEREVRQRVQEAVREEVRQVGKEAQRGE